MKALPFLRLMRLHQPVGAVLLLWPCYWSIALCGGGQWRLPLLALFAAGALIMRAAGCVINDLWDRRIDAAVARTSARPLASGEITPQAAFLLLALLMSLALAVAMLLGLRVALWSAASLPLVAAYPLMKRITWWPQAFLGLTFNWGALTGSVAVTGHVTLPALMLYAAGFCWTLGYDTIYAFQDAADDAAIGVKSTALYFGPWAKPWIAAFYLACIGFLALSGAMSGAGYLFYLLLAPVSFHFIWQINRLSIENPVICRRIFLSNAVAGGFIYLACLAGS